MTCLSQSTRLTDRNVARESKNHATVIPSHMLFFSLHRAPDVQKEKPCVNRYRMSRPVATAEPTPTHGARLYCPYAYMETVGRSFSLHWHFGPRVTVCLFHIIYKLPRIRERRPFCNFGVLGLYTLQYCFEGIYLVQHIYIGYESCPNYYYYYCYSMENMKISSKGRILKTISVTSHRQWCGAYYTNYRRRPLCKKS